MGEASMRVVQHHTTLRCFYAFMIIIYNFFCLLFDKPFVKIYLHFALAYNLKYTSVAIYFGTRKALLPYCDDEEDEGEEEAWAMQG